MVRVGQFFNLGFDGKAEPSDRLKQIQRKFGLGGVTFFARNIESPEKVARLNRKLHGLDPSRTVLISVDQEGGRTQRLKPPGFQAWPGAFAIRPEAAFEVGRGIGSELRELGFSAVWAPVLDVNTNPKNPIIGDRSFSSNPGIVTKVGGDMIRGLQSKGILACGKHFPGHGETWEDSHITLPVVDLPLGRLQKVEIVPFKELIRRGLRCIMTAHVLYPGLDSKNPATFSHSIITGLLRKQMGYEGIVVSDDLGMAGALNRADIPEACVLAFVAGCDVLLICQDLERHEEILSAFGRELKKSPALQKRAEESLGRVEAVTREIIGGRIGGFEKRA